MRRREGVMREGPGLRLLIPLEKGKIGNPEEFVIVSVSFFLEGLVIGLEAFCEIEAQLAGLLVEPQVIAGRRRNADARRKDDEPVLRLDARKAAVFRRGCVDALSQCRVLRA